MSAGTVVLRTPAYLGVLCSFALLAAGIALGAALDPAVGWSWTAAALVGTPLVLAARSLLLCVRVTDSEVVVRSFFRTHRLARNRVATVSVVNYDGLWQGGDGRSRFLTSLTIATPDAEVAAR